MSVHSTSTIPRWFCHACENYFPQPDNPEEPRCFSCYSSFVEEMPIPNQSQPNGNRYPRQFAHPFHDSDSPPIPSTRQRYEQQQQNQHAQPHRQPPFINFIDPLINILSAPSIPDPPDPDHLPSSSHPTPPPRSGPHALTSIGDFLAQHYSPQTFSNAPTPPANRSDQTNESGNNNNNNSHNSENSSNPFILTPAQPAQGAFSFTFGSRNSNPIHNNSQPPSAQRRLSADPARPSADEGTPNEDRSTLGTPPTPPAQPMNGILSLLQSAFGLMPSNSPAPENERRAAENHTHNTPAPEAAASEDQPPSPSGSTEPRAASPSEDRPGESAPRIQPRHTPRSPRVNLEESHPLRQFINILNSLNQQSSEATMSGNEVNGFVGGFGFANGTGGGGFGFTTTHLDMDQNGGGTFGQNLGDYVASDSAMQDILNQLINMTGVNGGHNPTPASESTIKSLRTFKFDPASMGQEDPVECAICKDTFAAGDACMELPCKHFFHDEDCIVLWLKQNGSCPVCRYSLVNNEDAHGDHAGEQREGGGERGAATAGAAESSTASGDDSQYRPDAADWLDPDRWYDDEPMDAPFDYD
ncbi:hypothetical protein PCANC_23435 [Puccinia coronata f. sp. avenae]|uniref:RING-type domain-containing protein n=1 Tax=Puccinia coronata f. sp. avenae TaxID=200324 RepID=A0A2N5SGM7_9BASI|nr:hypothetical protein PCANC_23435 [Puccinia coronata f. sp. avenae]